MSTLKTFGTNVAVKLLGGTHFVGQTIADLSLQAECNLVAPLATSTDAQRLSVVSSRERRSYERAVRLGLFKEPSLAIADMTQSEQ